MHGVVIFVLIHLIYVLFAQPIRFQRSQSALSWDETINVEQSKVFEFVFIQLFAL
jgi:hypothetical protein